MDIEKVILDYFIKKRDENDDNNFIDYSIYDIIIKNILITKDEVKELFKCDDDTRIKVEEENLELVNIKDKIDDTCVIYRKTYDINNLTNNNELYTTLINERIRLNNILIDICIWYSQSSNLIYLLNFIINILLMSFSKRLIYKKLCGSAVAISYILKRASLLSWSLLLLGSADSSSCNNSISLKFLTL